MEEAFSLPAADPANPGKSRRERQLTILIACVIIAAALWFLRALENDYTTRVDHPVRYINLPEKMIALNPLPQRISLEVKGLGFSVLRHNWNFSKTPLIIDIKKLKSFPAKRKKGFIEYLPMNQYFNEFSAQLKDLKVLAIIPDSLLFRFAFKKTRMIKVVPAFVYDFGLSIIPDSLVRVDPDSVEAEGPDLILDTLRSIRTLPVKINRQGASFSRSFGLEEIHKLVKTKPTKVTVTIGKKN
jgi:hypothetical protein